MPERTFGQDHRRIGHGSEEEPQSETRTSLRADTPIAAQWGRFDLRQKVGEGGFGSVYRAWDPDLEREIAVKILKRDIGGEPLRDSLLREGRALARIRHPNVVSVLGIEAEHEQVALCMEFVHGETLEEVLRTNGTLSAREAAVVGEDVCRALAAVHLAGFVHRDVKARNIMREQAGRIVLMDFGAGREECRPGRDEIGTPAYMAPEVLLGAPATVTSDIYSVGVLLYHLVTGKYPVEGKTMEEVAAAHRHKRRRPLSERRPELSLDFMQVVDRALAFDPERRYPSAAALLEALGAIGDDPFSQRAIGLAAGVGLGSVALITFFGFLTTSAFNLSVGRTPPFDAEPRTVWVEMGLRSLVTPIVYGSAMVLVAWAAQFGLRVLRLIKPIDQAARRVVAHVARVAARLNLDDADVFAQAVTALGVIALAAIVWQFSDLLRALFALINDAPAEVLRPLRWDGERVAPSLYRFSLDVLAVFLIVALVRMRRMQARKPPIRLRPMLPIIGLLTLTALMLETPYRFGWHFAERVDAAGERCYLLGEAAGDGLIYCPDRNPPRNRVINLSDPAVRRIGTAESIFSPQPAR